MGRRQRHRPAPAGDNGDRTLFNIFVDQFVFDDNDQLVAVHSGRRIDVYNDSTTPRAGIVQYTCDPTSALSTKKNRTWRLHGLT